MTVRVVRLMLGALLSFTLFGEAKSAEILRGPLAARIVRIIDGDTLIVKVRIWLDQEVETRVRLSGIDTPEIHGRCPEEKRMAQRARAFVEQIAGSDEVFLHDVQYGKFARRVVARVSSARSLNFASTLVRSGLARPYDGKKRMSWCNTKEH